MPNHVRVLMVADADRAELERRARSKGGSGPGGRAGPDRAAGCRRADGRADCRAGGLHRAGGDQVAAAICRAGAGRAGGRPARRRAGDGADRGGGLRDPGRDRDPAAGVAAGTGGHALAGSPAGGLAAHRPEAGSQPRQRDPRAAPVLPAAAPHRGVQVLHRPAAGRQGPRCRRPVPGPARQRSRGMPG